MRPKGEHFPTIQKYLTPQMFCRRYAYLAVLPKEPFPGVLFAGLKRIYIVPIKVPYSLKPEYTLPLATKKRWLRLEHTLTNACGELNKRADRYAINACPSPNIFAYLESHRDFKTAMWHAHEARFWFHMLGAELSYLTLAWGKKWEYQLQQAKFPETFIAAISQSRLPDPTLPRVG